MRDVGEISENIKWGNVEVYTTYIHTPNILRTDNITSLEREPHIFVSYNTLPISLFLHNFTVFHSLFLLCASECSFVCVFAVNLMCIHPCPWRLSRGSLDSV